MAATHASLKSLFLLFTGRMSSRHNKCTRSRRGSFISKASVLLEKYTSNCPALSIFNNASVSNRFAYFEYPRYAAFSVHEFVIKIVVECFKLQSLQSRVHNIGTTLYVSN